MPATARCSPSRPIRGSNITGVDILAHGYTVECVDFLKGEFPGRVHLFPGDSREVLPWLADRARRAGLRSLCIDGGHTDEVCLSDMTHCVRMGRGPEGSSSPARRRPRELDLRHLLRVRRARRPDDRNFLRRLGGRGPQRAGADPVNETGAMSSTATSPPSGMAGRSTRSPGPVSPLSAAEGAVLGLYSYDFRLDAPPGVPPRGRAVDLPGRDAGSPLPRRRQAVDRDIRRHVPLPDDPGNRLLLGRRRPRLPKNARVPRDPYIFCRQADAVSTLLVNNAVLRLPRSDPALAELVATAESSGRRRRTMGRARAVSADAGPGEAWPLRQGVRAARLLPDRARAVLEAVPAELARLVAEAVEGATFLHLWSEAIRWAGYDLPTSARPRAPICGSAFAGSARSNVSPAPADEDEVRRLMGKAIAQSEMAPASGGSQADGGDINL